MGLNLSEHSEHEKEVVVQVLEDFALEVVSFVEGGRVSEFNQGLHGAALQEVHSGHDSLL